MGKIFSGGGSGDSGAWPGFELRSNLPKLQKGASGADVIYLERCLKALGFLQREPLGRFDDVLVSAVQTFQVKHKLTKDGIVGTAQTWPKIHELIRAKTNPPATAPEPSPAGSTRPTTPWMKAARKMIGKKETDPSFDKEMAAKWPLVGLKSNTIQGNTWAWCGLFVAVVLSASGAEHATNGALARNWRFFGIGIDYVADGIPESAIVHINHGAVCKPSVHGTCTAAKRAELKKKACASSSSNHVALANGDCAAADATRPGGTIDLLGGNQGNMVKVSTYSNDEICHVRWPILKFWGWPGKITKSVNCTSGSRGTESTR